VIEVVAGAMILVGGPVAWATQSPTADVLQNSDITRVALVGTFLSSVAPTTVALDASMIGQANVAPPFCEAIPTLPENVRALASMQCEVANRTFGDNLDPSAAFKFMSPVTGAGLFLGTDGHGRSVSFESIQSVVIPLRELHPDQFTEQDKGYACFGWLQGSAGRVPVSAACLKKESITGDPMASFLMVTGILSVADMLVIVQSARILDGARVISVETGESVPVSQVASGQELSGLSSEPGTLYAATAPVGGIVPLPDCVTIAYQRYAAVDKAASERLGICMVKATIVFSVCMELCALATFLVVACCLACLAIQANEMSDFTANYMSDKKLNLEMLRLDLLACGVVVVNQ